MQKVSKFYFLSGAVIAFLCVAVLSGNGLLSSLMAGNSFGDLQREIRLGMEIGIINGKQARSNDLNKNVSARVFAERAAVIMKLLGHPEPTVDYLRKSGIMTDTRKNTRLSKKNAFEIMAKLCEDFTEYFSMKYPGGVSEDYADYKIPELYIEPAAYLQTRSIISKNEIGILGAKSKLSNRESIIWLYRLYEAVSADKIALAYPDSLSFVDMDKNHTMLPTIKNLMANGAFDRVTLNASFDGEGFITKQDLAGIYHGLVSHGGNNADAIKIDNIFSGKSNDFYATRSELALVTESLLDVMMVNATPAEINIEYKDVNPNDKEYSALRKIAGSCKIYLGYCDKTLRGKENVSRFEACNVINAALNYYRRSIFFGRMTHKSEYKSVFVGELKDEPTRKEIDDFISVLTTKRDKIRSILGHEKRPSGKIY